MILCGWKCRGGREGKEGKSIDDGGGSGNIAAKGNCRRLITKQGHKGSHRLNNSKAACNRYYCTNNFLLLASKKKTKL